ncbi:MAG: restriction endonuclease subunit R, partial [Methanothrix sp.]
NKFLLALLNSTLFNYIHIIKFYSARIPQGSLRYPISFLSILPIRLIDFDNMRDVDLYNNIIDLVDIILALNVNISETKTGHEKTLLRRQIEATDRQIDRLVYELYGLNEEEIKIVEDGTS